MLNVTEVNKFNVIKLDINAFYSNLSKKEQEEKVDRKTRDITPIFNGAVVEELIPAFPNCGITEDDSIADALLKIYAKTGEQFVVILDEYDVLIRERVSEQVFKSYLNFLNAMFKNDSLAPAIVLAYITGILPVVRDKVQSKLNVFREYTMAGASRERFPRIHHGGCKPAI